MSLFLTSLLSFGSGCCLICGLDSFANRLRGRETFFSAALGVCRLTQDVVAFGNRFVVPIPTRIADDWQSPERSVHSPIAAFFL